MKQRNYNPIYTTIIYNSNKATMTEVRSGSEDCPSWAPILYVTIRSIVHSNALEASTVEAVGLFVCTLSHKKERQHAVKVSVQCFSSLGLRERITSKRPKVNQSVRMRDSPIKHLLAEDSSLKTRPGLPVSRIADVFLFDVFLSIDSANSFLIMCDCKTLESLIFS